MHFQLPPGFLLGVATAAAQIEGGNPDHNWNDWARKGHIKDGSSPTRANDHYARVHEDTALLKELNVQTYRFGVEWARIEPECGLFDSEALSHYREELMELKACGIQPLVTLHHFTNPMWFERMGAFEKAENIPHFLRYVEQVVRCLGDLAAEYITINEPNVYALNGYFNGEWPPGKQSMLQTFRVMSILAECHLQAYPLIHRVRQEMGFTDTKVGFANHLCVFTPEHPNNLFHRFCTPLLERLFQGSLTRAMTTGKCTWPIMPLSAREPGLFVDFHGLNYYSRHAVSGFHDGFLKDCPKNDLGWEIYPDGIVECATKLHQLSPLPIYVTENGTCDNLDSFRSRYIYEHLKKLCASGLPVERYYHWCFIDNFEWAEGESARFGLVHVDYETQQRTVKDSGRFYAAMTAAHGVDEALYQAYVADHPYPGEDGASQDSKEARV